MVSDSPFVPLLWLCIYNFRVSILRHSPCSTFRLIIVRALKLKKKETRTRNQKHARYLLNVAFASASSNHLTLQWTKLPNQRCCWNLIGIFDSQSGDSSRAPCSSILCFGEQFTPFTIPCQFGLETQAIFTRRCYQSSGTTPVSPTAQQFAN